MQRSAHTRREHSSSLTRVGNAITHQLNIRSEKISRVLGTGKTSNIISNIMLQLARAYDVDTNTLMVDAGDIRISAELIGSVFGIPSHVIVANCSIPRRRANPRIAEKNPSHLVIKVEFQKKTTTQLREFVFAYPIETEQQRMSFRRYFIMVVLKMFLNPTSQQTISPWHLPPILDVSNPRSNPRLVRGESCLSVGADLDEAPKKKFQEEMSQEALLRRW
ncbi:hypothetical protein HN51_009670 [Arachis hypogaea]